MRHGGDGPGGSATPSALHRCRELAVARQTALTEETKVLERFVRASVRQLQHSCPTEGSAAVDESGILEHFEVSCLTRRGVARARF